MKKIMLCCAAGLSTSMLMKKMRTEAETRGVEVQIEAFGAQQFDEQAPHYQVVLLGPQIKYMQADLQKRAEALGIKVEPIDMMDYGMQRADKVLDFAFSLIEG
ncbi:PTS sugar transporter subunit IIB [Vibrio aestuarianus]|uniref:PTS sugar transporter subunit IIB n=1 Tax=Vibrio aestuarianus TaxID=28171 RepID=UPI00237CDB24|nr:PTS sugar transporter subunit IIB [Vibrio aestuarianus]MDE1248506.1 PTS sugar transporter subunit IIB [Vibrio aestuarianus]